MDIRRLQRLIVDALEDVKGQDIKVFNTAGLTGLFDRIVIASGTSNRQTKALAASVRDKVKEGGGHIIGVEGEETGEWVLVDLGDAVVHIMQPPIRSYYNLEEIWGAKPVNLKAADAKAAGKKPAEAADEDTADETNKPAKRVAVKRAAAIEPAGGEAIAKKAAARKTPVNKAAALKTPARKAAKKTAKAAVRET
jgi:ribosome-associated protein